MTVRSSGGPTRSGIPLGPLHYGHLASNVFGWHPLHWNINLLKNNRKYLGFLPVDKGVLLPSGITFFGRGKLASTPRPAVTSVP